MPVSVFTVNKELSSPQTKTEALDRTNDGKEAQCGNRHAGGQAHVARRRRVRAPARATQHDSPHAEITSRAWPARAREEPGRPNS
jgi:hypothetical protein